MISESLLAKIIHDFSSPVTSLYLMYEMGSTDARSLHQSIQSLVVRIKLYRYLLTSDALTWQEVTSLLTELCALHGITLKYEEWPDEIALNKLVLGLCFLICERVGSGELTIRTEAGELFIGHPEYMDTKSKELYDRILEDSFYKVQILLRGFCIKFVTTI